MALIGASGQTAALQQVISDLQQLQQTVDLLSNITGTTTTTTTTATTTAAAAELRTVYLLIDFRMHFQRNSSSFMLFACP